MDLEVRTFETAIINFCNSSGLPMEVKRLVLANITRQMEKEADAAVQAEIAKRNRREAKEKAKKGKEVAKDAESIQHAELGKLSQRQDTDKRKKSE